MWAEGRLPTHGQGVADQLGAAVGVQLICMCFLAWSRSCTTQAQYVVRHSLWHAVRAFCATHHTPWVPPLAPEVMGVPFCLQVSALGLVYLAHKDSAGLMHDIASLG